MTIVSQSGNPDDTIVEADDPNDPVFYVNTWLNLYGATNISGLKITGGSAGISFSGASCDNYLHNNNISNNGAGITFGAHSDQNVLTNNTVSNNGYGISFAARCLDNELNNNTISFNEGSGVIIYDSDRNELNNNSINFNGGSGAEIDFSKNNRLVGNTLSNNGVGVTVTHFIGPNIVYNNYFNNMDNVNVGASTIDTAWNTTKTAGINIMDGPYMGGNYWAKPDGTGFSQTNVDMDEDGISDAIYTIDEVNVDHLPLVHKEVGVSFMDVNVSEAKNMIDGKEFFLLDARNQAEFDGGYIKGAILIPYEQLSSRLNEVPSGENILVYCKNGSRSVIACDILVNTGNIEVYNMEGGITAWNAAGYPVVTYNPYDKNENYVIDIGEVSAAIDDYRNLGPTSIADVSKLIDMYRSGMPYY